MDLCGRWSGGGWFCSNLLVLWGVSGVVVGWVLPICWWLIGFAGCEIWRLKFHSTGFEFNFLGFKFVGFVLLFKYIMCSCLNLLVLNLLSLCSWHEF